MASSLDWNWSAWGLKPDIIMLGLQRVFTSPRNVRRKTIVHRNSVQAEFADPHCSLSVFGARESVVARLRPRRRFCAIFTRGKGEMERVGPPLEKAIGEDDKVAAPRWIPTPTRLCRIVQ